MFSWLALAYMWCALLVGVGAVLDVKRAFGSAYIPWYGVALGAIVAMILSPLVLLSLLFRGGGAALTWLGTRIFVGWPSDIMRWSQKRERLTRIHRKQARRYPR